MAAFSRPQRRRCQRPYKYPDLLEWQDRRGDSLEDGGARAGTQFAGGVGDRVFFSGADPNLRQVLCFDGKSGQLLWRGDVPTTPLPAGEEFEIMEDTGYAAPTVATDGRRIYAIFPTGDVAGFDFKRPAAVAQESRPARQCLWLCVIARDLSEARAHSVRSERWQGRQVAVLCSGRCLRADGLGSETRVTKLVDDADRGGHRRQAAVDHGGGPVRRLLQSGGRQGTLAGRLRGLGIWRRRRSARAVWCW